MTPRLHISRVLMTTFLAFSISAAPVFAQGFGDTLKGGLDTAAPKELKGQSDPIVVIGGVISALLGVLGAVLFLYLLYGGFKYMIAGGSSDNVQEAKDIIKNAIIGIVIIAVSYAIATFVIDQLGKVTGAGGSQGQTQTK